MPLTSHKYSALRMADSAKVKTPGLASLGLSQTAAAMLHANCVAACILTVGVKLPTWTFEMIKRSKMILIMNLTVEMIKGTSGLSRALVLVETAVSMADDRDENAEMRTYVREATVSCRDGSVCSVSNDQPRGTGETFVDDFGNHSDIGRSVERSESTCLPPPAIEQCRLPSTTPCVIVPTVILSFGAMMFREQTSKWREGSLQLSRER
ncbi:hypothetical protein KCV03_g430, partial [Aureobasidium melanogenum]